MSHLNPMNDIKMGMSLAKHLGGMGGGGGLPGLGGGIPGLSMDDGGSVPGQAMVQGNSEQNDRIPALLSPGEVVLPRSVTVGGDTEAKALAFLRHLKGKQSGTYGDVLQARKMSKGGKC